MFNLICEGCGEHYEAERATSRFCKDYCRVKHWRGLQKEEAGLHWSICPYCRERFPHKNPKKRFCTPKCKTAYGRFQVKQQEDYDRYDRSHGYYAPPTPEEQITSMLERALREQELEDI